MILKKFFGKTIEVAKKSARQMYGDDIVVLESFHPEDGGEAGVTVLVDTLPAREKKEAPKEKRSGENTPFRNVFYKRRDAAARPANGQAEQKPGQGTGQSDETSTERSGQQPAGSAAQPQSENNVSRNLQALRDYASREERVKVENRQGGFAKPDGLRGGDGRFQPAQGAPEASEKPKNNPFSAGNTSFKPGMAKNRFQDAMRNGEKAPGAGEATAASDTGHTSASTRFEPSAPVYGPPSPWYAAEAAAGQQREVTALHKRFDKLEALLDATLISSNLDYASHPAFQQLIRTGIKTTVIARWFREIMESGIDPDEEPGQFIAALGDIIRKALKSRTDRALSRHILFAGPSGSGKTSLIMKLVQHPELLAGKQVAVASMMPDEKEGPYYTILEPFCRDRGIPFFGVRVSDGVLDELEAWKSFDHVLIDTPPIPVAQERGFREYWKMRQALVAATPLEVHYVINASLNRYYFRDTGSTHHPLQPDFVALTHLDEVSQWGPVIPFMEEMGCGSRFMSNGAGIPAGLKDFSPAWFAQQVLQDT